MFRSISVFRTQEIPFEAVLRLLRCLFGLDKNRLYYIGTNFHIQRKVATGIMK